MNKRIATLFDLARMCDTMDCSECKLNPCLTTMRCHPEWANDIVNDWCDEHPIKTYMSDFLEKFPDYIRDEYGAPAGLCPDGLYGNCVRCLCDGDVADNVVCIDCWNQPMEKENAN